MGVLYIIFPPGISKKNLLIWKYAGFVVFAVIVVDLCSFLTDNFSPGKNYSQFKSSRPLQPLNSSKSCFIDFSDTLFSD